MSVEVLTARITADVDEAIEGFRQVDREAKNLSVSAVDVARGFSGIVTAGYSLYRSYDMIARVQSDAKATQEDITKAYLHAAAVAVPGIISGIDSAIRTFTTLKTSLGAATIAQWLYNKALAVTHALSGPAGWAILGVAAAVTAGAIAWISLNNQQEEYNRTLSQTATQTKELVDLESELSRMSPIERLQREYVVVKRYYETFTERTEREEVKAGVSTSGGSVNVSVGRIEISSNNLGSSFDRDRAAEDLVREIGKRVALRGVAGR